jgi:hypothetical protein
MTVHQLVFRKIEKVAIEFMFIGRETEHVSAPHFRKIENVLSANALNVPHHIRCQERVADTEKG